MLAHAWLYDPATNQWSQTRLPKRMYGLDLMAGMAAGAHAGRMTSNLVHAAGCLASAFHSRARSDTTIRCDLIDVAARIARFGRGCLALHLPRAWDRQAEWMNLFQAACGPPAAAA